MSDLCPRLDHVHMAACNRSFNILGHSTVGFNYFSRSKTDLLASLGELLGVFGDSDVCVVDKQGLWRSGLELQGVVGKRNNLHTLIFRVQQSVGSSFLVTTGKCLPKADRHLNVDLVLRIGGRCKRVCGVDNKGELRANLLLNQD